MNGLAFRPTSQVIDKKNKKKKKKKTPRDRGVISFVSFVSFVFFSLPHVVRLSLGKLLVNLLQVGKRTNTPLMTLTVRRYPAARRFFIECCC